MTGYAELFKTGYGTSLLADAAFRAEIAVAMPASGIRPLNLRSKLAGPTVTVEANNDLVSILEAVHRAQEGDVVAIGNPTLDVALIGDLIGAEALRKGLAGFVVDGLVRDTVELIDLGVPVMCRGSFPAGPLKLPPGSKGVGVVGGTVSIGGAEAMPGTWAFGDADGLLFLEEEDLEVVFEKAATAALLEGSLSERIASGTALADVFDLEVFLRKRADDPGANFNAHLAEVNQAI